MHRTMLIDSWVQADDPGSIHVHMLYVLERVNIKGAWALTQFARDGGWMAGFNSGMLGRRCRVGLVHLIKCNRLDRARSTLMLIHSCSNL